MDVGLQGCLKQVGLFDFPRMTVKKKKGKTGRDYLVNSFALIFQSISFYW